MTFSPEHPLDAFGEPGRMLLRTLAGGRLSPSYLFEGADGEGLHAAARAFAAGVLSGCPPGVLDERTERLALAGTHPDLHELSKDKATVISVGALTSVLERAHATPMEARRQVFLVDPAEAMEPEGVARYLKTLEEPPETTVFVLVSTRAERLPDTVLSRCRRVRFPPMAVDALRDRLAADGHDDAGVTAAAARAAGGSLGRARRLAEHELVPLAFTLIEAALAGDPAIARTADEALAHLTRSATTMAATDPREGDTKREHVRGLLMDLIYVLMGEARERAAGRASELLAGVPPERSLGLIECWGRLGGAIPANVTPAALLIEIMACVRREPTASSQSERDVW